MQTEQKNIYIYNFSPIQRFQVSLQQILLNTESEEHTVQSVGTNRSLQRLLPFETHGVGLMDGTEGGRGEGRWGDEQERAAGNALQKVGSRDTHGELMDFIYWFLTFFLSGSLFPPSLGPTVVEKSHRGGRGLLRPAQNLQSTPGWPIVACGGASRSFHRRAGPAD